MTNWMRTLLLAVTIALSITAVGCKDPLADGGCGINDESGNPILCPSGE